MLGLALVALLMLNVFLAWIATGPRSIDKAIPYLEREIGKLDAGQSIKVENGYLLWDGWQNPIGIKLRNVKVYTSEGQLFAKFPEISLGLDIPALLVGQLIPNSITLGSPIVSLYQHADGSITFGVQGAEVQEPDAASVKVESWSEMFTRLTGTATARGLKHIVIKDASVSIGNERSGILTRVEHVRADFTHRWGNLDITFSARIPQKERTGIVAGQVHSPDDADSFIAKLQFSGVQPGDFGGLFASSEVSALQFPLSGWINGNIAKNGLPKQAQFELRAEKGRIESDTFEGGLSLASATVEGVITGVTRVSVTNAAIDLGGPVLSANGAADWGGEGLAVAAKASLRNLPVNEIKRVWPKTLSPMSREWVTQNINNGMVQEASVEVNAQPGELAQPHLPDEVIRGQVAFNGASVQYKPEHPQVTNVSGVVHVNANAMQVDISGAHFMTGSILQQGRLSIADLNADNPKIEIHGTVSAPASDVARFLSLPDMQHAQRLNIRPEDTKGSVNGEMTLGFLFFAPRDEKGHIKDEELVQYDIKGDVSGVTLPGFMKKFDIADATGKVEVDNRHIRFSGKAGVNQAASEGEVRYLFTPDENGLDTFINAAAVAPAIMLKEYGYPEKIVTDGPVKVNADVRLGHSVELIDARLDLTQAMMQLDLLNWRKEAGKPAQADVRVETKGERTTIPAFAFTSENEHAEGSAEMLRVGDLQRLQMSALKLGANDLVLEYIPTEKGFSLHAEGESADLTPFMEDKEGGDFSFEHMPVIDTEMKVRRVIMAEDRYVTDVSGRIQCEERFCPNVELSGKAGNAPFSYSIRRNGNGRMLEARAEDAGAFLRNFNLFDGIQGGQLRLSGTYDDTRPSRPLKGMFSISEHTISDAPALAKVLTLASLTGFVDTLQGKGITFVKLFVPYTLENDVITLLDARSYGPAMGLTAEGTIRFPGKKLDLKGTIVPSYTLNSFFSKVPLIGEILTGGKGEGIIAARYSISGTPEEPDVSVNPLSILTPGFLRHVFDIFDAPENKQ